MSKSRQRSTAGMIGMLPIYSDSFTASAVTIFQ